jgi:hypothetical protein
VCTAPMDLFHALLFRKTLTVLVVVADGVLILLMPIALVLC